MPPGVEFSLMAPDLEKKRVGVAEKPAMSKVHVKGPLGAFASLQMECVQGMKLIKWQARCSWIFQHI